MRRSSCGAVVSHWNHDKQDRKHAGHGRANQVCRLQPWLHLRRNWHWRVSSRRTDSAKCHDNTDTNDRRGRHQMDRAGHVAAPRLATDQHNAAVSIHRALLRPWLGKHHDDQPHTNTRIHHRVHVGLWAITLLLPSPALSQANATANPVANSSGSVTNMGILQQQGPWPNAHSGPNQISCQGPALSISPFVTHNHSFRLPRKDWVETPIYDQTTDDNDALLNPGNILYMQQAPTMQKDNFALNLGITATFSIPLDGGIQERCKAGMSIQNQIYQQKLATARLDYEIGRLKHCGQLALQGIRFKTGSPYADICRDVVVTAKPGQVLPHTHEIKAVKHGEEP